MKNNNEHDLLQELNTNGFTSIERPSSLVSVIKDGVYACINKLLFAKLNNLEELTNAIMQLKDEEFVKIFDKTNRFFDIETAKEINNYAKGMNVFFGSRMSGVNFISPNEVIRNSNLSSETLDTFFRCVRPGKPDVGRPHSDYQFWEIAKGTGAEPLLPFDYDQRWKIWLPLMGCNHDNSLRVLPGSHNMDVPFEYVNTSMGLRPTIQEQWIDAHRNDFITPDFPTQNSCVLFNDKLIHFGPENLTRELRISSEFTVLLKH